MTSFDRRITPVRPDLAAAHLAGQVESARFVEPRLMRVCAPSAWLRRSPAPDAPVDTEVLFGERVAVYETTEEGWAWGQVQTDDYVGWLSAEALSPAGDEADHRVATLRTFVYPGPSIKTTPLMALSIGSRLRVLDRQGPFALTDAGGFVFAAHLAPLASREADFVAVASTFVGTPYLWGGRTSLGLDCSALVQLSLAACGVAAPRDSDMQERGCGRPLPDLRNDALERGDLVFWKGHVGIMQDAQTLLHANGHHMLVVAEPFAEARARILDATGADVTSFKRF